MKKFLLAIFLFFVVLITEQEATGQSCVPTNINNSIINLSCGTPCATLSFQVPHIKSTQDYIFSSIPFSPLPYIVAFGSEDPNLYDDDFYSSEIILPFNFCFYDSSYNKVVVGSNGLITFDESNASCASSYAITGTIPGAATGFQCSQEDEYYPRAAIMAAFSDLLPTITGSPPGMKIQWRTEGTAPCRKFVVSFFEVGTFNNTSCSDVTPNTFQIILYESTGLIDIFIENKTCFSTSANAGAAIMGIQNWERDKAVAAPGKNGTQWTSVNEGFRFTPNGSTSKFGSAQLLNMTGLVLATADTATTVAGLLDVSFPNICPPPGTTQYVVRTTFGSCPAGTNLVSLDTITLSRNNTLPVTTTLAATTCSSSTGSITINVAPGVGIAPYIFSLNAGTPQVSNVFSGLAAGVYTAYASDATGCDTTFQVTILAGSTTSTPATTSNTSCPGANDGTIVITPVPGAVYTLSPGGLSNTTGIFAGLAAGTYSATFSLPPGTCVGNVTPSNLVIAAGPAIIGMATTTATSCPGVNDGRVLVTNPNTAGTTYTLNPGNVGSNTGIFTGLAPNTYSVTFITASGCTGGVSPNPVVVAGPALTSTFTRVNPVCANVNNGSISITPQASGTAPYSLTLTGPGGPYTQTGAAPLVFSNLSPGSYNYTFTSANGCAGAGSPITLSSNPAIMTPATVRRPLCNGSANGTVTFNPFGGVAPYQYSANAGSSYQASNIFSGLPAGTFSFRIRDNVGCTKDTSITLSQPPALTASASSPQTAGCSNNNGSISATATGGTTPYSYSLSGSPANNTGSATGIFTGVASGSYIITARDANGCTASANATVVLVDNMFLTLGRDTTICMESSVTFNPQTNPETSLFMWRSPDASISSLDNAAIKNAMATPADTARYILRAQWGTCVREDTILVNVLQKPVPNAGSDTAICDLSFAILRGTATNLSGAVSYAWTPTTNIEFPAQASTRVSPTGNNTTYTYTLTVKDNYGCNFTVTDQVNIRVQPPVPAFAGNDSIAVRGVPHQLFGNGGVSYMWTPSFPLNNPFNRNPLATLSTDTKFVLQVTDVAGCTGYDTVLIKVYVGPAYYVPNAFSPNGDGQNDAFRAIPVGITKTEWFRIFNRYGELVFETNQWLKGWDGSYKGKKQPMGAYIWVIKGTDRNGKTVEMKGTVMLVL